MNKQRSSHHGKRKSVNRDDVARHARVSTAVVSYVVNGGPRPVSARNRERVEVAIAELGYRPNGVARALRSRRSQVLGLIVPDNSNPFFAELARVVEEAAFEAGYLLLLGNSMEQDERGAAYVETFAERQVEGLLAIPVGHGHRGSRAMSTALGQFPAPIVALDRQLADAPLVSAIVVDNVGGGYLATRHLIEHGHARVACLAGPAEIRVATERKRGWRRAMLEAGLTPEGRLVAHAAFDRLTGYGATLELLAREARPTALFCCSDLQAIGAIAAASRLRLAVPGDLAISSFDGIPEAALSTPPLTTVSQPIEQIGRLAVQMLLERIAHPDLPPRQERIGVDLVVRASCGCRDYPGKEPTRRPDAQVDGDERRGGDGEELPSVAYTATGT